MDDQNQPDTGSDDARDTDFETAGGTGPAVLAGLLGAGAAGFNTAEGVGSALNVNGGTNHILTTQGVVSDEATLAWSEWRGARYIADTQHAFVASGSTQISPAVTLTGPGWVEVDWFGDGNTFGVEDFDWTVTASGEGTALGEWNVVDSRTRNHPNGWIQWKRWRKYFATPPASTSDTRLTLSSLTPAQGADWYATAIQAAWSPRASAALRTCGTRRPSSARPPAASSMRSRTWVPK